MQDPIPAKLQLLLTMINNHSSKNILALLASYWLLLILPITLKAQFIDLNLEIEPEVTAETQRSLTFGTIATNTGRHSVSLGDINMGIFSITALERQELLISINKPNSLSHNDSEVKQTIPIELFARYGFSYDNFRDSNVLSGTTNNIFMEQDGEAGPWNTMYIFIYGAIEVRNIPTGIYNAQVVLNVEYL